MAGSISFSTAGFDLKEFLSKESTPKPLQEVQAAFFSRDFRRFDRFERYEEALLGLHTHGEYNVPMFDLSKTNFRLLRSLMQGLLRLDRIDAVGCSGSSDPDRGEGAR